MTVQFILGRSGTGKSSCCIDQIAQNLRTCAKEKLILLVPEQGTYQAERAILADKAIKGYDRLNVVSFARLSFLISGPGSTPLLSPMAQSMIVHRILRLHKDQLSIFGGSAEKFGLARQMAALISEMHRFDNTPKDLEILAKKLHADSQPLKAMKFSDTCLVLKEYLEFIEGRFADPDIEFNRSRIKIADFAQNAKLWVDGFSGFSASELAMLTELLKHCQSSKIALCLDPAQIDLKNPAPDLNGIFAATEQTYTDLLERIKNCKLELDSSLILTNPQRFRNTEPLAHIEQNLFQLNADQALAGDKIKIISAANGRAEVQYVARQIRSLVKEKSYRYRDIAVVTSDIDYYQHYIRAYFPDYKIPFFLDKRRSIEQHPVIDLVCSALQAVENNFETPSIMACLKTSIAGFEPKQTEMLANYVLAFGIESRDWLSDFKFQPKDENFFDEIQINNLRRKIVTPLLKLQKAICPPDTENKITPEQFTRAVFTFLKSLHVKHHLSKYIQDAQNADDLETIEQHRQFYSKFVTIFDELCDIFTGHKMLSSDYIAIISAAFSQMTLGLIPPGLDQVLIGSIDRSRHPNLKAVFLIGTTQGQFPSALNQPGLLSDSDRQSAETNDLPLAPAADQKLVQRQYLAYIAFTRASELLCVTYPCVDEKDKPLVRSQFVTTLENIFTDLKEQFVTVTSPQIDSLCSEADLEDLLCSGLAGSESATRVQCRKLLSDISRDDRLAKIADRVKKAVQYTNSACLDDDVVSQLFGKTLRSSATRLSSFAACRYRYFADHILSLEERRRFEFRPLDIGEFYHKVLELVIEELIENKKDLASTTDDDLLKLTRKHISQVISQDSFISGFTSRRKHNLFIVDTICENLENCVLALKKTAAAGIFKPAGTEISFPSPKLSPTLKLSDGSKVTLSGKIDRFDIAHVDGKKIGIVFDYKRKNMSFSWPKFYHSLNLQLPLYMLALNDSKNDTEIIGAFYIPVEPDSNNSYKAKGIFNGEFVDHLDPETQKGSSPYYNFRITQKDYQYGYYSSSGALKEKDFQFVLSFSKRMIKQLCRDILAGKIDINPYRLGSDYPCQYCPFISLCRFDLQINRFNVLKSFNKTDILEEGQTNG